MAITDVMHLLYICTLISDYFDKAHRTADKADE